VGATIATIDEIVCAVTTVEREVIAIAQMAEHSRVHRTMRATMRGMKQATNGSTGGRKATGTATG
jgi:hypothetical protein